MLARIGIGRRNPLMNLSEVAARLDADEKLSVTYRFPVSTNNGHVEYQVREGKLLDVAEESKRLYVTLNGDVIWIKAEEVVSISTREQ
jgi:hypothetical protein